MSRRTGALGIAAGSLALVIGACPLAPSVARASSGTVVVRPGDTLSGIALRHRTTVAHLIALNHLANPNVIFAGQRLVLDAPAGSAARSTGSQAPGTRVHVVQPGEHLTGIAHQFGTTIDVIVQLNAIANPNRIFAGQALVVPVPSETTGSTVAAASRAVPATPTVAHRVAAGETLTALAQRYGTTITAIVALNHLVDPNAIRAGQVLRVPTPVAATGEITLSVRLLGGDVVRRMTARAPVRAIITSEARRAGIPVALALAVAWQESGWQQGLVSPAGAVGVMQLLPATGDWIATSMLSSSINLSDTRQNVRAGVTLLAHYLARYHGNRSLALAAYYQGQRSVDEHGIYPASQPYIASILALEAALGA